MCKTIDELKIKYGNSVIDKYIKKIETRWSGTQDKVAKIKKWIKEDGIRPIEQSLKVQGEIYVEKEKRILKYREFLKQENGALQERFRKKVIIPLKEEINRTSWLVFIEPLLVVNIDQSIVKLFSRDSIWINEHFKEIIEDKLGKKIIITDEIT